MLDHFPAVDVNRLCQQVDGARETGHHLTIITAAASTVPWRFDLGVYAEPLELFALAQSASRTPRRDLNRPPFTPGRSLLAGVG